MTKEFNFCRIALAVSTCFGMTAGAYAQTPPAAQQDAGQLQEIVVTAQRVESTVQKTPIAIQTISSSELLKQGVQNTKDLARLVPGLSVQQSGAGQAFFIRGVGNFNESSITDNGVAISLDQMFFSRQYGPDMALYDLQRVEVLKGPQGTLYGRNATGGSVNFISKKPILGSFGGNAAIEFGNYSAVKIDGAVNVPVSEDVAMRVAFQSNKHKGYTNDGYDDADTNAARLHLYWEPSDRTSLLLTGEYMHNGQKGPDSVPYPNHQYVTSNPYAGSGSEAVQNYVNTLEAGPRYFNNITAATFASGAYVADPRSCMPGCNQASLFVPSAPGPYQTELTKGFADVTVKSFRGDLEQNFGFATLSVIPAYLTTDATTLYYNSGSPIYAIQKDEQSSLEARLTSPQNQRLTWIAGAFYLKEKQNYSSWNASANFPTIESFNRNPDYKTETKALFAQASFKIIDTLTGTVGFRRTEEDKSSKNFDSGNIVDPTPAPAGPPGSPLVSAAPIYLFTPSATDSTSANTYRVGLDWQLSPQNLLYTAYSTGFHAGGFNTGSPPTRPLCTPNPSLSGFALNAAFTGCDVDNVFKPEKLNAFSIGSKNRFLHNTIQLNVEIYNWQYKDKQESTLGVGNPGITILRIDNAGDAKIQGLDLEASWLFTPDDLASISYNYNKSKYGDFTTYLVVLGAPFSTASSNTGKAFLNAPDNVLNFAYQHTFHLANGGKLIPSVDGRYSSKVTYDYATNLYQDANTKYNLNLGYSAPGGNWDANLFVRNVENKATISRAVPQGAGGIPWVFLNAPRTFGVNLSAKF